MKTTLRINIYRIITIFLLLTFAVLSIIFLYQAQYFRLVAVLFFFGLTIYIIPFLKFKWYKNEFEKFIHYLNIVIGTLAGVFLAIHFNQLETQKEKKIQVQKILQSTKGNIYACNRMTKKLLYNVTDTNGLNSYKNVKPYDKILPISLSEILKMEIVLEHINQSTIERLSASSSKVMTLHNYLYDNNKSYEEFNDIGSKYSFYLSVSFQLLENELKYLRSEISKDSLLLLNSMLMPEYEDLIK